MHPCIKNIKPGDILYYAPPYEREVAKALEIPYCHANGETIMVKACAVVRPGVSSVYDSSPYTIGTAGKPCWLSRIEKAPK